MTDYDDMFKSIRGLAEQLQVLNQQAVLAYTPIVDDILRSRSRDTNHIELTLDGLLSFCCYDPALQLYKKLCRHYFFINPVATAEYINAYREMWDSEEKEVLSKPGKKRVNTLECGDSAPLFGRPPRRPSKREPRLAKQSGAKAPHSKCMRKRKA
jgi:hypothetical protein